MIASKFLILRQKSNVMTATANISLSSNEKSLVEVLWNLYILQSVSVRTAFRQKIENEAIKETESQKDVKESFTRAYNELRAGDVKHNARNLFKN